jgi:hypothetical protein
MAKNWVQDDSSVRNSFNYGTNLTGGPNNPAVHSKGAANASRSGFKPTDSRQPSQPATIQRADVAPSAPAQSHTQRATIKARTVGHDPITGKWLQPVHTNTGKHGADGHHDPRKSTDNPSGQAHSSSGGQFGRPQQRPAGGKPSGTKTAHKNALAHGGKNDAGPRRIG